MRPAQATGVFMHKEDAGNGGLQCSSACGKQCVLFKGLMGPFVPVEGTYTISIKDVYYSYKECILSL